MHGDAGIVRALARGGVVELVEARLDAAKAALAGADDVEGLGDPHGALPAETGVNRNLAGLPLRHHLGVLGAGAGGEVLGAPRARVAPAQNLRGALVA